MSPQDVIASLCPLLPGVTVNRLAVAGVAPIARLVTGLNSQCGIYVLSFTDGEYYVGRTVSLVARLRRHRKIYDDIAEVLFWPMPNSAINAAEKAAIWCLEDAGFLLRNAIDVVELLGPTAFDEIVTPVERSRWLASPPVIETGVGARLDRPDQRRRNRTSLTRLMTDPASPTWYLACDATPLAPCRSLAVPS